MVEPRKVAPGGYDTSLRSPAPRIAWLLVVLGLADRARLAGHRRGRVAPTRLPAPFGPARNGILMSSQDGDIFAVDPLTATRSPVIAGPAFDFGATLLAGRDEVHVPSRARPTVASRTAASMLMVANADGSGVRALTPGPARPRLAGLVARRDADRLPVAPAPDGNGPSSTSSMSTAAGCERSTSAGRPTSCRGCRPTARRSSSEASISRPATRLRGSSPCDPDGTGLHADLDQAGGRLTTTTRRSPCRRTARVSPTSEWSGTSVQVHILTCDGRRSGPAAPDRSTAQMRRHLLAGRPQIAYLRADSDSLLQLVVAPADGSGTGIALGPRAPLGRTVRRSTTTASARTARRSSPTTTPTRRLASCPIDGSPERALPTVSSRSPAYQRLAP